MAWCRQAITWAKVDPDLCRHMALLGHNELSCIFDIWAKYFVAMFKDDESEHKASKVKLTHPLDKMAAISQTIYQMHFREWKNVYFD